MPNDPCMLLLYLSNECQNICTYCGLGRYRKSSEKHLPKLITSEIEVFDLIRLILLLVTMKQILENIITSQRITQIKMIFLLFHFSRNHCQQ
jgi:hypothetical protein